MEMNSLTGFKMKDKGDLKQKVQGKFFILITGKDYKDMMSPRRL